MTHSFPLSFPAGFWSKAYIFTSEEAVEVANVISVNRSIKMIPINMPCFLFIVTNLYKFNKNDSRE